MNESRVLARQFRSLHTSGELFVMPCAWDAISAILFEQAGFPCVGTTSGGVNWSKGRKDYVYNTPASDMIKAYGDIAKAISLPVSGDLENGYGENPETVAETITQAIAAGMVGGSIEDIQTVPNDQHGSNGVLFPLEQAVERIEYARRAADASQLEFTLTARCEVYYTESDRCFATAIERSKAYLDAGADCVFVPGLNELTLLSQFIKEVEGPVSFGMGATASPVSLSMLQDIGVTRVSTGGGITRAIYKLTQNIAAELSQQGTASYLNEVLSEADINKILEG